MADTTAIRATRFGLAAKLFAVLILLGAVAVLITGVLGYVRARDALEQTIFNQLTATRESKAHQVTIYFRSIRGEMRLLAASSSSTAGRCPRSCGSASSPGTRPTTCRWSAACSAPTRRSTSSCR
jgi:hypothetical protein